LSPPPPAKQRLICETQIPKEKGRKEYSADDRRE
jgi:hypothetical protein